MIEIYPHAEDTGEGCESEVWIRVEGADEGHLLINQYPFETETEAYENAERLVEELKKELDEPTWEYLQKVAKIAQPYNKDFRKGDTNG